MDAAIGEGHRLLLAAAPLRGRPALFVDRDGTLIEERHYLADPALVELVPGATASLRRFREAGFALILITNQSGIGSGRFGWADYEAVATRLRVLLDADGIAFDAEAVCGHDPVEGAHCGWRKPAAGMLIATAGALQADLKRSAGVGDKLSDVEAAANAGLAAAYHVLTGHGVAERGKVRQWAAPIPVAEIDSLAALSPGPSL